MTDHFKTFGIDRSFGVDRESLEHRFHEMQSESHPDRHIHADDARREQALSDSSDINRAYRTLRESVPRAKHLLALYDFTVAEQKQVPPTLLMTVMEAQEKLGELASSKDPGTKQRLMHELGKLAEDLDQMRTTLDNERERIGRAWDSEMHAETKQELNGVEQEQLGRMSQLLAERAYIETLYASVEAAEHGRTAVIKH